MSANVFLVIARASIKKNFELAPSRSATREVKMTFKVLAVHTIPESAIDLGKQVSFQLAVEEAAVVGPL